jgi:twinkle protein
VNTNQQQEPRHKLPCPKCDSSDAFTDYGNGWGKCFSCNANVNLQKVNVKAPERPIEESSFSPTNGTPEPLDVPSRGLQAATLAHYGVKTEVNESNREVERLIFPIYHKGQQTGEKIKVLADKQIFARGNARDPDFFGAHKVGDHGKLLIITEGEEDCMSAYQMLKRQGKDYKVVSLPSGANVSSVRKRLEWLETFETIVLNLDNDKVGTACAKEIADILSPGKVKIMTLPVKDANDFMLQSGDQSKLYLRALWNAQPYRPDGVVSLSSTWDLMWESEAIDSIPYPWVGLNDKLYGIREREIVTLTAGSGIGKSAVVRELEHWLLTNTNDNIGILALEESVARTSWGIVSVEANLPLSIREERKGVSPDDIKGWFDKTLGTDRLFTLDHFGSTSQENLLSRVRYMVKGLQCKWIVLDHLSIVVSAMDDMGDERKAIDSIMTKLRQLVEETGCGLFLVSHLRRTSSDKGHEQGLEVSLSHLRGSQAIAQLSDAVIALERNQQALDIRLANMTTIRIIKNRYAGLTGIAAHLAYDRTTGRLVEIDNIEEYLAPKIEEHGF